MKIVYDRINSMRGNLITVTAENVGLGELARIDLKDGRNVYASVFALRAIRSPCRCFKVHEEFQQGTKSLFSTGRCRRFMAKSLLGRRLNGSGKPIDGGPEIIGESINIGTTSFNPVKRIIPREMVRTNIPMIDVFNCLVKSQKIPIFSVAGEPYNALLMRIANQTDADVVIIGGMG